MTEPPYRRMMNCDTGHTVLVYDSLAVRIVAQTIVTHSLSILLLLSLPTNCLLSDYWS